MNSKQGEIYNSRAQAPRRKYSGIFIPEEKHTEKNRSNSTNRTECNTDSEDQRTFKLLMRFFIQVDPDRPVSPDVALILKPFRNARYGSINLIKAESVFHLLKN